MSGMLFYYRYFSFEFEQLRNVSNRFAIHMNILGNLGTDVGFENLYLF